MFTHRKLFSKPLNTALAALLLAATAPAWADNDAQFTQAVAAYNTGRYDQAFRLLQPLAQQGDVRAQYNLGILYRDGQGVAQDYRQAVAWFQKAANQELAQAQVNLGVRYEKGQGVVQNYQQALAWYQKAADQDDASAQNNLGKMYDKGQGVAQNY